MTGRKIGYIGFAPYIWAQTGTHIAGRFRRLGLPDISNVAVRGAFPLTEY
jgi:hypothetical protein